MVYFLAHIYLALSAFAVPSSGDKGLGDRRPQR